MAFKLYGTLAPNEGRYIIGGVTVPQKTIIVNSGVMKLGDKVEWTSTGFVQTGAGSTAANAPIGICVGVADKNGVYTAPDAGTTDTFTIAGTNQTVAKKCAFIDISPNTLYSVGADATLGTTTGSDLPGYGMNALASDGGQLAENTSEQSYSTSFHSWGVDSSDSTKVIVNCREVAHLTIRS